MGKTITELQEMIRILKETNNIFGVRLFDLEVENSNLTKRNTKYKVILKSEGRKEVVLNLSFIPKKGNIFQLSKPLIQSNCDIDTDEYSLEVRSVHFDIDKEGEISKITAWCKPY